MICEPIYAFINNICNAIVEKITSVNIKYAYHFAKTAVMSCLRKCVKSRSISPDSLTVRLGMKLATWAVVCVNVVRFSSPLGPISELSYFTMNYDI